MDVDLLALPLKVTVGLVVWTIALLTYRAFQAVIDGETFTASTKSHDSKAGSECKTSTGEYFLKSSEPCTCSGIITGVVSRISESDRYRLFHSEPGFSQMEVPLHVRLTCLEKLQPTGSTRARKLETVLEIEDESETSSTTSTVISRGGLPLHPHRGSFTLPHNHDETLQRDGPCINDWLPVTHESSKNSKSNINDGLNVDFTLPLTHYPLEKSTPRLEIVQVPHSECNYIKHDVPSNISAPISIIPVSDPHELHNGNALSNLGPKYDQLYQKLHQELSKFKNQKKTNPNQSNNNNADVTDHDVMVMHVHDHNQVVAEWYNDSHTKQENMISFSPKITPKKKTSIDNNEIALANPLKIPPSITPRLNKVPLYHGEVVASAAPVLEHQYIEASFEHNHECSISHKTETSLMDGVETNVNNANGHGDFPRTIIPNPDSTTEPYASIRKGIKRDEYPSNPLLEELRVVLPRININEQNHARTQVLIPNQNCGYGQIIRKTEEIKAKNINLNGNYDSEDLQTILDFSERDDAGIPPRDDNMHSMYNDPARVSPSVVQKQLSSRTSINRSYLETFSPGHKSLENGAGAFPGNLISIRRLSSGCSSINSSGDGWPTTWEDSSCDHSTPDSEIPAEDPIPILKNVCLCSGMIYGLVTLVDDGNGFRLLHSCGGISALDEISVRLAGIDAPEHPDQPFSEESKTHLAELVLQKYVDVETFGLDQCGRFLGMVYLPSSVNINLEMVRSGYAHVYTNSGAVYGEYEEEFKKLEKEAKILKKGLWSQEVVVLPEELKRN